MLRKTIGLAMALALLSACAVHLEGKGDATFLKHSARESERAGADRLFMAKALLQGGVSATEVRRQLEEGGATTDEAERVTTAASVLCGCGRQ
jgi:hypothetical protein